MAKEIMCKDKPWFNLYDEMGFEHEIDYPEIPLFEIVDRAARDYPESLAMVYLGK